MTDYELVDFVFSQNSLQTWAESTDLSDNWPVVYTLSNSKEIYIGETLNTRSRMHQHLASSSKNALTRVMVVVNKKFNKSACLDLESRLIQLFAADENYKVLNANAGILDAKYFEKEIYNESFEELFEILVKRKMLSKTVPELINSNLFKYSPFKALTDEQAVAVSGILDQILQKKKSNSTARIVIDGDPGTGKTIVAIYLMKLIKDIANLQNDFLVDEDSIFAEYMTLDNRQILEDYRVGLVIPQQSLRTTLSKVFSKTPGLTKKMIVKPFSVGTSDQKWDLLIVDEAHRLSMRANQAFPTLNTLYVKINKKLFGKDDLEITQLDWIEAQSQNQVLLLDPAQSIKPADIPRSEIDKLILQAKLENSYFKLTSQLRVSAGNDYVGYIQKLLSDNPKPNPGFGDYELKHFDSFTEMRNAILQKDEEVGLSRVLAGYAWKWLSKKSPGTPDIQIESLELFWNRTDKDWINSENSVFEVGSIHTIQGYDLNYAGVVLGKDIGLDSKTGNLTFRRENYFDAKGILNNNMLGIKYSDEDILQWVLNIYRVLLTRGIKGTYIYICDDALRDRLRPFIERAEN